MSNTIKTITARLQAHAQLTATMVSEGEQERLGIEISKRLGVKPEMFMPGTYKLPMSLKQAAAGLAKLGWTDQQKNPGKDVLRNTDNLLVTKDGEWPLLLEQVDPKRTMMSISQDDRKWSTGFHPEEALEALSKKIMPRGSKLGNDTSRYIRVGIKIAEADNVRKQVVEKAKQEGFKPFGSYGSSGGAAITLVKTGFQLEISANYKSDGTATLYVTLKFDLRRGL